MIITVQCANTTLNTFNCLGSKECLLTIAVESGCCVTIFDDDDDDVVVDDDVRIAYTVQLLTHSVNDTNTAGATPCKYAALIDHVY